MNKSMMDYLESVYYDPSKPGSFGGPKALYKAVKSEGKRVISMGKIKRWLKSQEVYTMHRRTVRKFKRNKVYVEKMDQMWDVDLMDMNQYAKQNDGTKFVLLAIDILSRFAWAVPLLNKKAPTVQEGFDKLLEKSQPRQPVKIRSDHGGEFVNARMKKWFKTRRILHSVTTNEVKANYVERLIKTIKRRIIKMFQHRNSFKYVDELDDIMDGYNNTYHSSIKRRPASVNSDNEDIVYYDLYVVPLMREPVKKRSKVSEKKTNKKKKSTKKSAFRFKIGDEVRISYLRRLFDREYDQTWTGEVFTVADRYIRDGIPVYSLKDYGKDPVTGTFYEPELQAVTLDADQPFKIEKVIRTRGKGRNKEIFVKWLNWPNKYNSWVKERDVKDLL